MGQGLYNRLAWGIINPPEATYKDDDWLMVVDLPNKFGLCFAYESKTPYLVVPICTDNGADYRDAAMPDRYAVPFADLLAKITSEGDIETAKATWAEARAAALALTGIDLGDGCLIWINDYD